MLIVFVLLSFYCYVQIFPNLEDFMDAQQGFASQGKSNEAVEIEGCICNLEVSSINSCDTFVQWYRLCNSLHTLPYPIGTV